MPQKSKNWVPVPDIPSCVRTSLTYDPTGPYTYKIQPDHEKSKRKQERGQ